MILEPRPGHSAQMFCRPTVGLAYCLFPLAHHPVSESLLNRCYLGLGKTRSYQNVEIFPTIFLRALKRDGCLMCEFLPFSPDDEQLGTMCAFVRKFCDQNYHGQPFGYLG